MNINKLPEGVEVHGNKIRIFFTYNQEQIKEPLNMVANPENIKYAAHKVQLIKTEIATHSFNFAAHFPQSKRIKENQLNKWLDLYLQEKGSAISKATLRTYIGRINNDIRPHLGEYPVTELNYDRLLKWQRENLKHLSSKTKREVLANLTAALDIAVRSNILTRNPCQFVHPEKSDPPEPDPFSLAEIDRILTTPTHYPTGQNLAKFMLYTGARVSEALAVAIEDIDLKNGVWHCQRATVEYQLKVTKTRRSNRKHELMPEALDAILDQIRIRTGATAQPFEILQRDNQTYRTQRLTFLFPNRSGNIWGKASDYWAGWWTHHLEQAGVRHRGAGQCRHTYISNMLSLDMPTQWIIEQVGHISEQMIRRHYGKWIQHKGAARQSDIASQKLKALSQNKAP